MASRVTALLLLVSSGLACAQPKPAAGLWEHSSTMKSQSGETEQALAQAQAQMAKLPPEQRKQIEALMAQRGVGLSDKGHTIRVCLTPDDAARGLLPEQQDKCKQDITRRSASGYQVKFSCTDAPPSHGEGEIQFQSPKAYTSKMRLETVRNGKPERLDVTSSGRWLSADCGNIKPMTRELGK